MSKRHSPEAIDAMLSLMDRFRSSSKNEDDTLIYNFSVNSGFTYPSRPNDLMYVPSLMVIRYNTTTKEVSMLGLTKVYYHQIEQDALCYFTKNDYTDNEFNQIVEACKCDGNPVYILGFLKSIYGDNYTRMIPYKEFNFFDDDPSSKWYDCHVHTKMLSLFEDYFNKPIEEITLGMFSYA